MRKISNVNVDLEKQEVFESNIDMGFKVYSDESEGEGDERNPHLDKTPSGSNSMNSNNFSRMDKDQDDEEK